MDDFVSFPEMLDLAPYLAPNRNDYKVTPTASGPRAPYMDWASPEQGPELEPVLYRLYGTEIVFLLVRLAHAWLAVVVHLGTMIGGHYIAYCLVDPQKMFEDPEVSIDGMAALSINGSAGEKPQSKEDNRVWCFCSE